MQNSDFELAKDGPEGDNSHVSTRGTLGYAAPEYIVTGIPIFFKLESAKISHSLCVLPFEYISYTSLNVVMLLVAIVCV